MDDERAIDTSYVEIYNSFFKDIVENPDGTLNKDQVMRELADYTVFMDTASKVYCNITHGRISKINTNADAIISVYEDCVNELIDDHVNDIKNDLCEDCQKHLSPEV